jgi:hypothetical protein
VKQHAGFVIPACCPQTWEHVAVMAGAVIKMLDVATFVGLGPENHNFGGFKAPNFAVRCLIEAN